MGEGVGGWGEGVQGNVSCKFRKSSIDVSSHGSRGGGSMAAHNT